MDVEVTIDDRKAYTRPWTVTIKQTLMAEDELIEFVCQENERFQQSLPVTLSGLS
jgi:hypothetical protein